jgi:hypothetical protein
MIHSADYSVLPTSIVSSKFPRYEHFPKDITISLSKFSQSPIVRILHNDSFIEQSCLLSTLLYLTFAIILLYVRPNVPSPYIISTILRFCLSRGHTRTTFATIRALPAQKSDLASSKITANYIILQGRGAADSNPDEQYASQCKRIEDGHVIRSRRLRFPAPRSARRLPTLLLPEAAVRATVAGRP